MFGHRRHIVQQVHVDVDRFEGFVALCAYKSLEEAVAAGYRRRGDNAVGGIGHCSLFADFVEHEATESCTEIAREGFDKDVVFYVEGLAFDEEVDFTLSSLAVGQEKYGVLGILLAGTQFGRGRGHFLCLQRQILAQYLIYLFERSDTGVVDFALVIGRCLELGSQVGDRKGNQIADGQALQVVRTVVVQDIRGKGVFQNAYIALFHLAGTECATDETLQLLVVEFGEEDLFREQLAGLYQIFLVTAHHHIHIVIVDGVGTVGVQFAHGPFECQRFDVGQHTGVVHQFDRIFEFRHFACADTIFQRHGEDVVFGVEVVEQFAAGVDFFLLNRVEVAVFHFGHIDGDAFYPFGIFRFLAFFRLDRFVGRFFQFFAFAVEVFGLLYVQSQVVVGEIFFSYGFHLVDGYGIDLIFVVDNIRGIGAGIEERSEYIGFGFVRLHLQGVLPDHVLFDGVERCFVEIAVLQLG